MSFTIFLVTVAKQQHQLLCKFCHQVFFYFFAEAFVRFNSVFVINCGRTKCSLLLFYFPICLLLWIKVINFIGPHSFGQTLSSSTDLGQVVQKADITIQRIALFVLLIHIHWIAIYPVDSVIQPIQPAPERSGTSAKIPSGTGDSFIKVRAHRHTLYLERR